MTTITAHSGCEGTSRDSMESIEKAIQYHADAVEVDIRQDCSGILRISHNELPDEEYFRQPTLEEVFFRIKETEMMINCDIKNAGIILPVIHLAQKHGFTKDRLILTGSASWEQLTDSFIVNSTQVYINLEQALKIFYIPAIQNQKRTDELIKLLSDPWLYVNEYNKIEEYIKNILDLIKIFHLKGINLPHARLSDELAEKLNHRKIPFSVWTVNDASIADRCFQLGADNITTLFPSMLFRRRSCFY